jgi:hypothetical protein
MTEEANRTSTATLDEGESSRPGVVAESTSRLPASGVEPGRAKRQSDYRPAAEAAADKPEKPEGPIVEVAPERPDKPIVEVAPDKPGTYDPADKPIVEVAPERPEKKPGGPIV